MIHSLADFARDLTKAAVAVKLWEEQVLEHAAKVVEKEAKRVIGTYDYGWPPLAEATKEDRTRLGFVADKPLLRTGELRDSISHAVKAPEAYVGSTSKIAVYQEMGTSRIPPRPFLSGAARAKEKEIHEKISHSVHLMIAAQLGLVAPHKP